MIAAIGELIQAMEDGDGLRAREFLRRMRSSKKGMIKECTNIPVADNSMKEIIRKCSSIHFPPQKSPTNQSVIPFHNDEGVSRPISIQTHGRKPVGMQNSSGSRTVLAQSSIKTLDQKKLSESASDELMMRKLSPESKLLPKIEEDQEEQRTPNKSISCCFCDEKFPTLIYLQNHQLHQHTIPMLEAELPPGSNEHALATLMALLLSTIDHSLKILKCPICGQREKSISEMKIHVLCTHFSIEFGKIPHDLEGIGKNLVKVEIRKKGDELKVVALGNEEEPEAPHKKLKLNSNLHASPVNSEKESLICSFCERKFDDSDILRRHHLTWHSIQVLKDELPLGTTEKELESVFEGILASLEGRKRCPYCQEKGQALCQIRTHILNCHLEEVIKILERVKFERYKLKVREGI